MKTEYFKSTASGQWYFRIVARNGKTIAQSEGYKRKGGALAALASIKAGMPTAKGPFLVSVQGL